MSIDNGDEQEKINQAIQEYIKGDTTQQEISNKYQIKLARFKYYYVRYLKEHE